MQEKIVDFIWKNELFDVHITCAKPRDEIHRLRKINVAIIITMNKEHRRLPGIDRSDRGGVVGKFGELGRNIFAVPVVGGPIVNAVEVDSGGEEIGIAREAERGEEAAVTAAP